MHKKLIAEALGTFTLTLAVIASIQSGAAPIPTPAVAGLVVALFVYTVGWISGAHFNPAVTIGLWVGKHINHLGGSRTPGALIEGFTFTL